MKLRTKILRICGNCKKEEAIRKDGAGINCRSCRARLNSNNKIGKYHDIGNKRFGRLLAIEISHKQKNHYYWKCLCDCGQYIATSGNRLRSGKTKSCGCIVKNQNGLSTSPTYRSWRAMLQRCYDTSVAHYRNYGDKGISVCDRWRKSFSDFLKDMGERPLGNTLDRINPFGNYDIVNCKWSTYKEQSNNKRKNHAKAEENGFEESKA